LERDETPEDGPQSNLDAILSSPNPPTDTATARQLQELSAVKTPKTLPRLARAEMNPKEVHQTTTKAPDSGLRLGFADITDTKSSHTLAEAQNTPSKTDPRASLPPHLTAASFDFKFASESKLSEEARELMNNVREDAERIKQHILAEKDTQALKDNEADRIFGGVNATGRRIAKAQGQAGRFSDVHMAQFKKMDSIANHPSSFRAKPNFAQPTSQSLKRSGSKAGLDEAERPRTAGKGTPGRLPPPFGQRSTGFSPQKPLPSYSMGSGKREDDPPVKKRKSTFGDISTGSAVTKDDENAASRPSTLPRAKSGVSNSLLTPTKSSLARSNMSKVPQVSPGKISMLPRSNSVKSMKTAIEACPTSDTNATNLSPPKQAGLVRSESTKSIRPLPPLPSNALILPTKSPSCNTTSKPLPSIPAMASSPSKYNLASKLPTFQGLKSILRPSRQATSRAIESPKKEDSCAGGTPKRSNSTVPPDSGSTKKVDFTPSTKSRYAVKLAAASPSPSKLPPAQSTARSGPVVPYDPAAYTLEEDSDDEWEDAASEVDYPVLPTGDDSLPSTPNVAPVSRTFTQKAKEHNRRESKEFKSIFTTLEHPSRSNTPATLTDVNTKVNVKGAGVIPHYQNKPNVVTRSPSSVPSAAKPSPSTIRRVRSSGVSNLIQPFEDTIKTVPHGLPGKKRRRESEIDDAQHSFDDDSKENRQFSIMPSVPGSWEDSKIDEADDEGQKRGGKRAKTEPSVPRSEQDEGVVKKTNKARETAARNAKDRKSGMPGRMGAIKEEKAGGGARSILSMARLNMLSRPKDRR
jgi:hypothetical protein